MDSKLSGVLDMLEEAAIQLSEASDELRHYHDRLDLDPNRLFELEQRISRRLPWRVSISHAGRAAGLSGSAGRAAAAGRQRGLAGIP
jgi:hypothetical protein